MDPVKNPIGQYGEFNYIRRFKPNFDTLLTESEVGIGDDCAVIPNGADSILVTTDMLLEDIHFIRDAISPEELGYKSLAVNLSDIAAMGGTPIGSFLSMAVPSNIEVSYLDGFMEGYYSLSAKYNVPLLGGDTTKSSDKIAINVGVLGKAKNNQIKYRKDAVVGDAICVTGPLGDSAAGLEAVLKHTENTNLIKSLKRKHHKPEPRVNEGMFLASMPEVHAMMDVSDGLASDLKHILELSDVSAEVNVNTIPVSDEFKMACKQYAWDYNKLLVGVGEDYELLFTVEDNMFDELNEDFHKKFGKNIFKIGNIIEGPQEVKWFNNHNLIDLKTKGFDHFNN